MTIRPPGIWMKTKAAALENYDIVNFVCNAADAEIISKIVGDEYTFRRGVAVGEFIETLTGKSQIQKNEMNIVNTRQTQSYNSSFSADTYSM